MSYLTAPTPHTRNQDHQERPGAVPRREGAP
ncbi:hypothetical protein Ae168Ps1_6038c [Pseudonocardia sp. Ae168_Ps1]|nr:hypothetical protein Ae150APs1_5983c [Pseudonocardia sp. Ae150A_Ps1]OLL70573.1 hypothetical protein Ae168Ps1_6038c [Pseudonocardia sp. Ae168_Ps1]OLL89819.1 hypothetical protein Ae331Ps2_6155 [Pseudonocardia sp. Ae331_Ps2]